MHADNKKNTRALHSTKVDINYIQFRQLSLNKF